MRKIPTERNSVHSAAHFAAEQPVQPPQPNLYYQPTTPGFTPIQPDFVPPQPPKKDNKKLIIGIAAGAAALLVIGIIVACVLIFGGDKSKDDDSDKDTKPKTEAVTDGDNVTDGDKNNEPVTDDDKKPTDPPTETETQNPLVGKWKTTLTQYEPNTDYTFTFVIDLVVKADGTMTMGYDKAALRKTYEEFYNDKVDDIDALVEERGFDSFDEVLDYSVAQASSTWGGSGTWNDSELICVLLGRKEKMKYTFRNSDTIVVTDSAGEEMVFKRA